jgi:hypothetical protein
VKIPVELKGHRSVAKVDKEGHDASEIIITLRTEHVAEYAHALVDLMGAGTLICELKPLQRTLAMANGKSVE